MPGVRHRSVTRRSILVRRAVALVDPLESPEVVRSRVVMGSRHAQTLLGWSTKGILLGLLVMVLHGMMVLGKVLLQMTDTAGVARAVAAAVQRFGGRCGGVQHVGWSLLGIVGTVVEVGFVQSGADHGRL